MEISTSVLAIKNNLNQKLELLEKTNTDYIHLDVMDNIFVNNYSDFSSFNSSKKLDVHLMVEDVIKYVDIYSKLNPTYITFHYEVAENKNNLINYIRNKNIKVGLSIKPNTSIEEILPYLDKIDLVLVMSVEPGYGGQAFIESSISRVNQLYKLKQENNYNFKIEVDGGINNINAKLLKADILVVGTYVTNSDNYNEKINLLKEI